LYGAGTAPNLLNGVTTIRTSASANEVPLLVQNNATLSGFKTAAIDLVAVNGDARLLAGNETTASGANGYLALHTRTSEALTEKVRITSSGNVGIGTTTPNVSGVLHVNKSQNVGTSVFVTNDSTGADAGASFRAGLNPSNFGTDYISGGILGTNFPTLGILKAKSGLLECFGSNFIISNYNNSEPIIFATTTSRTERMRLTAAGRLLLGTTTESTFLLDVNGTARVNGRFSLTQTSANRNLDIFSGDTTAQFYVGSAITDYTFYNTGGFGLLKLNTNPLPTAGGNLLELPRSGTSFAPTSGSANFTALSFQFSINQTGGANGITRGIFISPTLTSATDWRAIEVTAGVSVLAPSTTASATLRIPSGTAPTSPVNGDIWFDGTDLKMRIGGVTKTFTLV
jgi:hypothetical protein